MTPGYLALREGAAFIDLTGRAHIRLTGEDRARLLHAMTTNHVARLEPGQWCYAFFLNAQGRMLADANILCRDGEMLLDAEPGSRQFVLSHLDHYIIADDVEVTDLTDEVVVLGLEGPQAAEVVERIGIDGHWPISSTGAPGYRFFAPKAEAEALKQSLIDAGATEALAADAEAVRLEHALPKYGLDLSDAHIPHEARLAGAVHFNKGCYLGQEIVERVRSRGKPNRLLTHMEIAGTTPIAAGTRLFAADGKELGEITSSAYSPAEGKVLALGYLRTEATAPGSRVFADSPEGKIEASTTARLTEHAAV